MFSRAIAVNDSSRIAKTVSEELKRGHGLIIVQKGNMAVTTAFIPSNPREWDSLTYQERNFLSSSKSQKSVLRRKKSIIEESARAFVELVRSSLTVRETAKLLNVNPSRIRQRLGGHPRTLYGFKIGEEWFVPCFQFDDNTVIPGIDKVIRELDPNLHPLSVARWFTTPNQDLAVGTDDMPLSPLDWLKGGNPPKIPVELAADL